MILASFLAHPIDQFLRQLPLSRRSLLFVRLERYISMATMFVLPAGVLLCTSVKAGFEFK